VAQAIDRAQRGVAGTVVGGGRTSIELQAVVALEARITHFADREAVAQVGRQVQVAGGVEQRHRRTRRGDDLFGVDDRGARVGVELHALGNGRNVVVDRGKHV